MIRNPTSPLLFMTVCALTGCENTPPVSRPVPSPTPTRTIIPDNPISDLAQREIIRRQERVRQMDAMALAANRSLSENDLERAVSGFRQASTGTPR